MTPEQQLAELEREIRAARCEGLSSSRKVIVRAS